MLDIILAQVELEKQAHTEVGHSEKEVVDTAAAKVVGVLVVKFDIAPNASLTKLRIN